MRTYCCKQSLLGITSVQGEAQPAADGLATHRCITTLWSERAQNYRRGVSVVCQIVRCGSVWLDSVLVFILDYCELTKMHLSCSTAAARSRAHADVTGSRKTAKSHGVCEVVDL